MGMGMGFGWAFLGTLGCFSRGDGGGFVGLLLIVCM